MGGRESACRPEDQELLRRLRDEPTVGWGDIRALKHRALARAFTHFRDKEWQSGSARRKALEAFVDRNRDWLTDYALFSVLHELQHKAWWDWPEPLKTRQPAGHGADPGTAGRRRSCSATGCSGSWTISGTGPGPRPGRWGSP